MPRKQFEFQGGTWNEIDLVANYDELVANSAEDRLRRLAMSGDMVLKCTPATAGSSAAAVAAAIAGTASKFVRTVTVTLETAGGEVHTWFSGKRDAAAAQVTAGNGTAAVTGSATDITFVNGSATVLIDYVGTWAAADTCTLTVTGATLLGHTLANKTSIDTLVA